MVIQSKNISKHFGHFRAVADLSFDVEAGECFGFLGPNGAGKSTLMSIVYGKAKRDTPHSAPMSVLGFDPHTHSLNIKNHCGVVPQDNNLDEQLNVVENLQVYARFYGLPKASASRQIDYLLEFLALNEKRNVRIKALSGGMKRRLVIARALLHKPKLLILDEPSTGLDPQVRHLIWDKLRQLKEQGMTLLLTTHYMEEAFQLCDRLLMMDKGRCVLSGVPQDLLIQHLEKYVLEIHQNGNGNADKLTLNGLPIRKDETRIPPLFFSNDMAALNQLAEQVQGGHFDLRRVNLEDLFLKITGRKLNAQQ